MIPILFEGDEQAFTTNGLGRLSDAISCRVIEVRNGEYELEMLYPVDGIHYSDITDDRIIFAKPADDENNQAFRIFKIEKPINGKVKVLAEHISYLLNQTVAIPFTATSCSEAIALLPTKLSQTSPFTFWTDKQVTGNFKLEVPKPVRSVLGGTEGSFLDVYGKGEYKFDNFSVMLYLNRGVDNGVTIRYGKNLTDLNNTADSQSTFTGIVPYWKGRGEDYTQDIYKMLPQIVVWSSHQWEYSYARVIPIDFSDKFEEEPSDAALLDAANQYISSSEGWAIDKSITVSFVQLWQTEEYKNIAPLEHVKLCDIVTVIHPELGVSEKLKVTKTDYDVLLERYNSITLGDTTSTKLVTDIAGVDRKIQTSQVQVRTDMEKALGKATELIRGGLGGYVVMKPNADGYPEEILILDEPNLEDAVHVIRINKNGIAFSEHGYDPQPPDTYKTAWTIDGSFVADFITSGTMNANIIRAGTITSTVNPSNWWNLETGELHIGADIAQEIAQYIDASGYILRAPYKLNRNVALLEAELYKGDVEISHEFIPGSFTWWKKEDYKIEYLNAGYTFEFDLSNFVYGGSIILQFRPLDYWGLLDDDYNNLLTDDGDRLIGLDILDEKGPLKLVDDENEGLLTDDDFALKVYDYIKTTKPITVEVDFTNGTRVAELEVTADHILSRLNHFNGTNKTFESEFTQTAESIRTSVRETENRMNLKIDNDIINVRDEFDSEITQTAREINTRVTAVQNDVETNYETKSDAIVKKTTLESQIKQTARSISLGVSQREHTDNQTAQASITVSIGYLDPDDGQQHTYTTPAGNINLDGYVTFTNLSNVNTRTYINGGNIHSGTIRLGGTEAMYGNGVLEVYDINNFKIGSWTRENGIETISTNNKIRTTIINGTWHLYRNANTSGEPSWGEVGTIGLFDFSVRGKTGRKENIYGLNTLSANTSGFVIAIDGHPYYAMNSSEYSNEGLDLSGYGFRHYFEGDIYCTNVFKTSCGYGWFGENWGEPWVVTGANVQVGEYGSYGYLRVLRGIIDNYGSSQGSDIRLKTDIDDISLETSKKTILGLKPVQFRYKGEMENLRHGFIAQDAQNVADWDLVGSMMDEEKHLSLRYDDLIADLVNIVQDQERRIKELEVKNECVSRQ